jgi:hypothetical protein
MIIYLKSAPCGHWCQKGKKLLFTKIDSKGGENLKGKPKGEKIGRNDKRTGSTKILSTQVGGASS